ncbi:zinc ribbon domain-containing protein [Amycolatopsis mediterranei]|uniref:zinc ribbon domain-containing protein n=2 Tax=Amycolatopsis mediterranei TaxID=33910 RepID=UPI000ACAC6A1|nr:zinc ribbon domain-containing protein [Amycolatopsis mediterranei]UZF75390.1 zinc ribbon domain-containing protein [Amycolatopsis mediterranei]
MTTLVNCRTCRNAVAPGAAACPRCGEAVERTPCPHCDASVQPDARFCHRCGRSLTAAAGDEVQDPPTPPNGYAVAADPFVRPWQPSRKAGLVTAVVVSVLVVLGAGLFVVQKVVFTPEAALNGYFDALAERDAETAASYLAGDRLSGDMLRSPDYQPPAGLKIHDVEDDGDDTKTASISFVVGGHEQSGKVQLTRRRTHTWGVFRDWAISDLRPTLRITTTTAVPVRVDGETLATSGQRDDVEIPVFPGRHKVDIADNPLLEADQNVVDAALGATEVPLGVRVKASAQQAAQDQVKTYLDQCAGQKTAEPPNCPFRLAFYSEVVNVSWKITAYPEVELQQTQSGAVAVRTRTGSQGRVTVTGTQSGGTPYQDEQTFSVNGGIYPDQGRLVFAPN